MKTSVLVHLVLIAQLAFATGLSAISPASLRERLASGSALTVVDVRSTALFQRSHIPGAINIPAAIIQEKTLPRLGSVVVYDDGLADTNAAFAVIALNRKPGISAELLNGGLAAWESADAETTRESGVSREELPQISYQKLKATAAEEITLVDLRQPSVGAETKAGTKNTPASLSDLTTEFPGAAVTRSPFDAAVARSDKAGRVPLLVLIDNNDGAAERMARALKANGVKRFVVLTGGEEIIARKGQKGLQRAGGGSIEVQKPNLVPSRTPNP